MATAFAALGYDLRLDQRYPTKINTRVVNAGYTSSAVINNISAQGALIKSGDPPPVGAMVEIKARKLDSVATVIWASASAFGVRFHMPIKPLEAVRNNHEGLEHLRQLRSVK